VKRISAASFVIEPGNLWRRRITRRYLDQAPMITSTDGEKVFVCPAHPAIRIPLKSVPWYEEPIASSDAWVRARAVHSAGVESEIIYPTFAWSLFAIGDRELQTACIRSYNNWIFELCTASPARFQERGDDSHH
jgi:hypothetical protein